MSTGRDGLKVKQGSVALQRCPVRIIRNVNFYLRRIFGSPVLPELAPLVVVVVEVGTASG
jgi:hypothetical protein